MKKYNCPNCGKELINLTDYDNVSTFWCDECDIEIVVNDRDMDYINKLKYMDMAYRVIYTHRKMLKSRMVNITEYIEFCMGYIRALQDAELIVTGQFDALYEYIMDEFDD